MNTEPPAQEPATLSTGLTPPAGLLVGKVSVSRIRTQEPASIVERVVVLEEEVDYTEPEQGPANTSP